MQYLFAKATPVNKTYDDWFTKLLETIIWTVFGRLNKFNKEQTTDLSGFQIKFFTNSFEQDEYLNHSQYYFSSTKCFLFLGYWCNNILFYILCIASFNQNNIFLMPSIIHTQIFIAYFFQTKTYLKRKEKNVWTCKRKASNISIKIATLSIPMLHMKFWANWESH